MTDDTPDIHELRAKMEAENDEIFNQLLNARKNTDRTIALKLSGLSLKVFRNLPMDIEEQLFKYRQEVENLGDNYVPESLTEAKKPLYMILSSLCSESPYNKSEFWQIYDEKSNGDCANVLEEINDGLKKTKKR